jgi:hypothetical protein
MVIQRASRILRDGVSAGPRAVGADQGPCRHLTHLTYALTWNFRALSGGVRIRAPPASPRDSALMPRQERPGGTTQRLSTQECRQVCHHTAVSGGLRNIDSSLLWYRPGREQFPFAIRCYLLIFLVSRASPQAISPQQRCNVCAGFAIVPRVQDGMIVPLSGRTFAPLSLLHLCDCVRSPSLLYYSYSAS